MISKFMTIYVMSAVSRGLNGRDIISSKSRETSTVKEGYWWGDGAWALKWDGSGFETLGGLEEVTNGSVSSL